MLPHQRNKVDLSTLTDDERRLFQLYGKLPSKKDILKNKLKERKYFDSGDYALSKAGKASDVGVTNIGSQHPLPENIPHCHNNTPVGSPTVGSNPPSGSPVKETSHLHVKSPMASQEPTEGEVEGTTAAATTDSVEESREQTTEEEVAPTEDPTEKPKSPTVPGAVPIPTRG